MKQELKNQAVTIEIDEAGAELTAIKENATGINYLWNAEPLYWKRSSPVLFPIVGSLKNQQYTFEGQSYSMSQHGFARDMDFQVIAKEEDSIWFALDATEETQKAYPFQFRLEIGYRLNGNSIKVMWKVINQDDKTMYFSIGGHPAFMCPIDEQGKQSDYYIALEGCKDLKYRYINESGLALEAQESISLEEELLPVSEHLFDRDALIVEGNQTQKVSLVTPDKKPYLTVTFDAPLFGLWSPAKKNAPFICIEPWYGRCDGANFSGSLEERELGNVLPAGESFEKSYTIQIGE